MFKFLTSEKGFSLVELMIVVVVMSILLAIGIPSFGALTKTSKVKICNVQITELKSEVKNWCLLNNFNANYNYKITSVDKKATISGWEFEIDEAGVNMLLQEVHKGEVSTCPAGGTYFIRVVPVLDNNGNPVPGGTPKIEITCDCEGHSN